MASEFWEQRLAALYLQVTAIDGALLAFATDSVQSYTLDTGQTRVTKTRADIGSLNLQRERMLNEIAVLEVRLGKCHGSHFGGPAF